MLFRSSISGVCSRGAADADIAGATISLSTGLSGTYLSRQLIASIGRLNYNLYVDPARTLVWGNGVAGTSTVNALTLQVNGRFLNPGASRSFTLNVYGRIPANQSVRTGAYTDTIIVTVNY